MTFYRRLQRFGEELPLTLDIVGRISPETVWDYIGKMKSSNSKTISVIRLVAVNMEGGCLSGALQLPVESEPAQRRRERHQGRQGLLHPTARRTHAHTRSSTALIGTRLVTQFDTLLT